MMTIREQRSFTLIEMLVVLVIIGIVVSVGTVYLGGFGLNTAVKDTAAQLKQVMEVASEQAILQPAVIGMRIDNQGYRFYRSAVTSVSGQPQWLPLQDDKLSRPNAFSSRLSITVKTKHFDGDLDDNKLPEIVFFPSGLATPSVIMISAKHHTVVPHYVRLNNDSSVTSGRYQDE